MKGIIDWKLDDEDLRSIRLLEHIADTGRSPSITRLPEWAATVHSEVHTEALGHLGIFNDAGLLRMYEEHMALPNFDDQPDRRCCCLADPSRSS